MEELNAFNDWAIQLMTLHPICPGLQGAEVVDQLD